MLNHQFRQMNSVQMRDNLVLVGERHYDSRSEGLIQSVVLSLDEVGAVALEKNQPELYYKSETAMDFAETYATECDIPRYYIDKPHDWLFEQVEPELDGDEIIDDGNKFSVLPENNGEVDLQSICDARSRIKRKHGEKAFDALFTEREVHMAERLNWIRENTDGYVVAAVGVFHIYALLDFMELVNDTSEPRTYSQCLKDNLIYSDN